MLSISGVRRYVGLGPLEVHHHLFCLADVQVCTTQPRSPPRPCTKSSCPPLMHPTIVIRELLHITCVLPQICGVQIEQKESSNSLLRGPVLHISVL